VDCAFCLEISSELEIRFLEPNLYKNKCKSALVRQLFLYGLPNLYISAQVNKGLVTGCSIVLPNNSNNKNDYHKTLTGWVSAAAKCLEAN
jgi:hypothetical protein